MHSYPSVSKQERIDRYLAANASAYHVKRVRHAELVVTVKAQLAARRTLQSLAR